jgi:hypothetical protein
LKGTGPQTGAKAKERIAWKKRKRFFFEKKNQKTFVRLCARGWWGGRAPNIMRAGLVGRPRAK